MLIKLKKIIFFFYYFRKIKIEIGNFLKTLQLNIV